MEQRETFPFSAFVNQKKVKLALILPFINPKIDGVLLKGKKGTGKSQLVRALAEIAPPYKAVKNCDFRCDPENPSLMCSKCRRKWNRGEGEIVKRARKIITLPLGATEEMVTGTLDVEKALKTGEKEFQPGILAKVNRNILYIDEINLLPDHLINVILDAAAMNWNYVEREGISIKHPTKFLLIGSMNPEEGGLRPQLLDRLDLSISFKDIRDKKLRQEIIRRNLAFKENREQVKQEYQSKQKSLRRKIKKAKSISKKVAVQPPILRLIGKLCKELKVDGHRPDIVITHTAKAISAFRGKTYVRPKDVEMASILALGHRTRSRGKLPPPSENEIRETYRNMLKKLDIQEKITTEKETVSPQVKENTVNIPEKESKRFKSAYEPYTDYKAEENKKKAKKARKKGKPGGGLFGKWKRKAVKLKRKVKQVTGKFNQQIQSFWKDTLADRFLSTEKEKEEETVPLPHISMKDFNLSGKSKHSEIPEKLGRVPTPNQTNLPRKSGIRGFSRGKRTPIISKSRQGRYVRYESPKGPILDIAFGPTLRAAALRKKKRNKIEVSKEDVKVKVREHRAKAVFALVVDTSKSMWTYLSSVTRALLKFHEYAWRSKDKIGVIEARGEKARVILEPTSNIKKIKSAFFKIREGGNTPLASGMLNAYKMLTLESRRNRNLLPIGIVVSDGLGNVELKQGKTKQLRELLPKTYPSQTDILAVVRRFAVKNIPLLVVNPMHLDKWEYQNVISPTKILKEVARRTNGKYVGIRRHHFFKKEKEMIAEQMFKVIRDSLQDLLHSAVN